MANKDNQAVAKAIVSKWLSAGGAWFWLPEEVREELDSSSCTHALNILKGLIAGALDDVEREER